MAKYTAAEKSMAGVGFMLTGIVLVAILVLAYSFVEKRHFFNERIRAKVCKQQLVQIYQAKLDYARDFEFENGAAVRTEDIIDYLEGGIDAASCPSGGTYTLGTVGHMPSCSISEHNAH